MGELDATAINILISNKRKYVIRNLRVVYINMMNEECNVNSVMFDM